ncbi:hypothetical protein B9Z19DRAFT_1149392 [Tuber borchii]|uniref:DUF6536 domain-containing protein n=1 Tax=Tuber borchii TaxID=42251 RepID=A0A2T6ZLU3_TUBBO|nr:hypothetical protein B9Z19DRAFT_1149392 [Tuber borchii]
MSNFRTRLPKWTAISLGDSNHYRRQDGGGRRGNISSSIELSPLDPEFARGEPNPSSSAWKPVWYTGWHTGVLACATSVVVVLLINVGLTIHAATNPKYKMEGGIGTLYSGNCDLSRAIGLWLHLGINALSTVLLSGSNYTQQCLAAPTRSEIDTAHARIRWMDIGVPSVRNLFRIKAERTLLWIAIGITSIPLHLLYNSAVYTSLVVNYPRIVIVTKNHFEPGAYTNTSSPVFSFPEPDIPSTTTGEKDSDYQLFYSMLEGRNTGTGRYEDLTPSQCAKRYSTDFLSTNRNLFLITSHASNATHNDTFLDSIDFWLNDISPSRWMCGHNPEGESQSGDQCNPNELASNVTKGLPWQMDRTAGLIEISGCKSERTAEKCKVQFSLRIMIAVVCCNLVTACSIIIAVVRSREPTLVTLGDAIDSFLRIPDQTTMGICYANRRFIEKEWAWRMRTGPREWNQKEVQRWWSSVSKTRWITSTCFCSITIIAAGVLLRLGIRHDAYLFKTDIISMWSRGLGKVNSVSLLTIGFRKITQSILLVNFPQTILSFLYLTYNSLFTCMLAGHEWSLFSHHHRTLRVTSPRPGQRSTYWLQIPYTYAIPLMTTSSLLHWLASQSIFFVRVEFPNQFGEDFSIVMCSVGYSCIAIIFVLAMGVLAFLAALGMGYKKLSADITTVGCCSAAISAACHAWGADSEDIVGRKVRWGDVGMVSNLGARHLTFSSKEDVSKPVFGEAYAGAVRVECGCL